MANKPSRCLLGLQQGRVLGKPSKPPCWRPGALGSRTEAPRHRGPAPYEGLDMRWTTGFHSPACSCSQDSPVVRWGRMDPPHSCSCNFVNALCMAAPQLLRPAPHPAAAAMTSVAAPRLLRVAACRHDATAAPAACWRIDLANSTIHLGQNMGRVSTILTARQHQHIVRHYCWREVLHLLQAARQRGGWRQGGNWH